VDEVLTLAAAAELRSEHPVALALVREARHRGLALPEATEFTALPGRGARARVNGQIVLAGRPDLFGVIPDEVRALLDAAEAEGQSVILAGTEHELLGLVAIADALRPESAEAVGALKRAGVAHTIMLTGDNPVVARAVAHAVGLDEFRAELLPEDKVAAVQALAREHRTVAMVGDGVNDAPALASATVGIVMGVAGTDVAMETADIALMRDDLREVAFTIALSRAARRTVLINIAFALGLKALFVALALTGQATLWMAVFADMGASLLVTFNGMFAALPPEGARARDSSRDSSRDCRGSSRGPSRSAVPSAVASPRDAGRPAAAVSHSALALLAGCSAPGADRRRARRRRWRPATGDAIAEAGGPELRRSSRRRTSRSARTAWRSVAEGRPAAGRARVHERLPRRGRSG
jgi:soluble P-type ATPase